MSFRTLAVLTPILLLSTTACERREAPPVAQQQVPAEAPLDEMALRTGAKALFGVLPAEAASERNPVTDAKVALGRVLYHDPRLSLAEDVSCNSCHDLRRFGVDNQPTSPGHEGQRGDRNSPTVFNAALHTSQFWDGRAADVEEQAKGPILNPIEMAMPDAAVVEARLKAIPGYAPLFAAAFPEADDAVTFDHVALAIAAFERRLMTPSPFDAWLEGKGTLTPEQLTGLQTFVETGCTSCHGGPALGGTSFMKLGLVRPYPTEDPGRFAVTGVESDRHVFKVPSLRNVVGTGPYFHDGSVTTLEDAIRRMAAHQLGRELDAEQVASIRAFLGALSGEPPQDLVTPPELPPRP